MTNSKLTCGQKQWTKDSRTKKMTFKIRKIINKMLIKIKIKKQK